MPLRLRPPLEPTTDPAKESTKEVRPVDPVTGEPLFATSGPFEVMGRAARSYGGRSY